VCGLLHPKKISEEGFEQSFIRAAISSEPAHEGWKALDDGGFSGGSARHIRHPGKTAELESIRNSE
jgi:hypothetical protein